MATSLTWRGAHAWLAGYSDALAESDTSVNRTNWSEYEADYDRGYEAGRARLKARV